MADRPVAAAVRVADGAEPHGHGRAPDVGQAKLRGQRAVARDGRRELPAVIGVHDVQKRMAVEPLDVIGSVAQMLIKESLLAYVTVRLSSSNPSTTPTA